MANKILPRFDWESLDDARHYFNLVRENPKSRDAKLCMKPGCPGFIQQSQTWQNLKDHPPVASVHIANAKKVKLE